MVPNLKLFLSLSYAFVGSIVSLLGCDGDGNGLISNSPNNRLLVVVDQSQSVSYQGKANEVKDIITEAFDKTYRNVKQPTAYYMSNITSETNVVPQPIPFDKTYPDVEELGGTSIITELGNWQSERNNWMTSGIENISNDILRSKSGNTDVYSVFETIKMVGSKLSQKDTLQVLFFSDMKQSVKNYELETLLQNNNPSQMAKKEWERLVKQEGVKPLDEKFHCIIRIVVPNNFNNSKAVVQYWSSLFKEWGPDAIVDFQ